MSFLLRLPEEVYERDALNGLAGDGFNIGTARALCWLSQLAYEDNDEKVDSILGKWNLRRHAVFRRPVTSVLPLTVSRGFVAEGRGFVFVAFAGTDPIVAADWAINLDITHNAEGIHRGFANAMDAGWRQIATTLASLQSPARRFLVTGHSLGAALAVLFAQRLKNESGITPDGIYTFGMPRLGSEKFAHRFNQKLGAKTYRLIYGEDIVARIPTSEMGYRHVGRSLLVKSNNRFDAGHLSDVPSDAPLLAGKLRALLKTAATPAQEESVLSDARVNASEWLLRLLPPPIGDHVPARYRRALRQS
jgi:hypothetical protein